MDYLYVYYYYINNGKKTFACVPRTSIVNALVGPCITYRCTPKQGVFVVSIHKKEGTIQFVTYKGKLILVYAIIMCLLDSFLFLYPRF